MSDFKDALRYAMGVDLASPSQLKTATEIDRKYIQPVYDAMVRDEGLTVAKLMEAKRRLLDYTMHPPVLFMETKDIDPRVFKQLKTFTWGYDPATQEATVTTKKAKVEKFNTIGVRFPENPTKQYTYKVRIGAKPYLGQELVADTDRGQAVVFVTRIDKVPQPSSDGITKLRYIDRKAVAL